MDYDRIKVMELVRKLTVVLNDGKDIETCVTSLSLCLGFALGHMDEDERKDCRRYINKTIGEAIDHTKESQGKWGVLLGHLMSEM
jgi:hypothetical protein